MYFPTLQGNYRTRRDHSNNDGRPIEERKTSHSKESPPLLKRRGSELTDYRKQKETYHRFNDLLQICGVNKYSGKLWLSKKLIEMAYNLNSPTGNITQQAWFLPSKGGKE
jgi:hypothetical protein